MLHRQFLAALIVVIGLAAVSAASATATDIDSMKDVPIQADRARTFTPAAEGSIGPALPFPGLSPDQAETARASLAELDLQAAAAAVAADQAYAALGDETAAPIPVNLPPANLVAYEVAPNSDVELPRLAPGADDATTWGVWAMYGGSDHHLGSLEIDGHFFVDSMLFSEVNEANGPCATDLERGYLDNPRYWNTSSTQSVYTSATAAYQETCGNTTWESISGDHVADERETERFIFDDDTVWQY